MIGSELSVDEKLDTGREYTGFLDMVESMRRDKIKLNDSEVRTIMGFMQTFSVGMRSMGATEKTDIEEALDLFPSVLSAMGYDQKRIASFINYCSHGFDIEIPVWI